MGNDGGSIPKRRELVQEAARNPTTAELKEKQTEHQEHHWTHDPLTDQPLRPPIVSDHLGRLYNKDAILEYLLPLDDKTTAAKRAEQDAFVRGAVTRLKDVIEVKFRESTGDKQQAKWVCPVTDKQLGASTRAVYLVPCGHAFAAAAIREVADQQCLECDTAYAPNDVISILPTDTEEVARLILRMQTLREKGLAHSLKKDKSEGKKRKKAAEAGEVVGDGVEASSLKTKDEEALTQDKKTTKANIKDAATASLTARVLAEQQATAKRRRLADSGREHIDSLYSKPEAVSAKGKNRDFMTRGYAISR